MTLYTGITEIDKNNISPISPPGTEMLTINNFLFKAQIDNINFFKVFNSEGPVCIAWEGLFTKSVTTFSGL